LTKSDLETVRTAAEALTDRIDALLDKGPRLVVVTVNGQVVNIRSTDPTVQVEVMELNLPEGEDPDGMSLRNYPFELY
jgi:hypothetical protein